MRIEQGNSGAPKKPTGNGAGKNQKKILMIAAIAVVAVALIVGGIFLFKSLGGEDEVVSSEPPISSDTPSSEPDEPVVDEVVDEFDPEYGILSKFVEQYEANRDFLGHISIPNTLLDIDVAMSPDESNSYYLERNLAKEYDPYGIPFADGRARFGHGIQSPIATIYGHNSKNGDYFEGVKSYKDIEYYKQNPIIEFDTIYGSGKYKIIGVFSMFVKGDFFAYHDYTNVDEADFDKYLTELDKVNYYDSGIDVEFGDNIIALSTCSDEIINSTTTPYRDVLVARKVRPGEDVEVDVENIKPNLDMVMPEGWVKKFGKENPYK